MKPICVIENATTDEDAKIRPDTADSRGGAATLMTGPENTSYGCRLRYESNLSSVGTYNQGPKNGTFIKQAVIRVFAPHNPDTQPRVEIEVFILSGSVNQKKPDFTCMYIPEEDKLNVYQGNTKRDFMKSQRWSFNIQQILVGALSRVGASV
jgi:hypothetical protein